jgi:hypothetical protein
MTSYRNRKSTQLSPPSSPPNVCSVPAVPEDWTLHVDSEDEIELPGLAANCSLNDESENAHHHSSDEAAEEIDEADEEDEEGNIDEEDEEGDIDEEEEIHEKVKKGKAKGVGGGFTAKQWNVIVSNNNAYKCVQLLTCCVA